MEMAATNSITKSDLYGKKDSMKHVITMCLLFSVLIFGRAANNILFYAFAAISLAVFIFNSVSHCFSLLLFLLPFSTVLKTNVDGMSFFTVLFFITVFKMLLSKRAIRINILIGIMVYATYCIIFSGLGQITTIITTVAGFIMLYCLRQENVDIDISITTFSLGLVISSILALLKNNFPIVKVFIHDIMMKTGESDYFARFSGLQGNPNYYTLDINIVLAILIVLLVYKKRNYMNTVWLILLSILGLMSVSKSFLLSFLILIAIWSFISIKQGVGKLGKFLMIAVVGIIIIYYLAYDYVNLYIYRLSEDSGATLRSITTGRTDIWKDYFYEIFSNPKIMMFGNGLKTLIPSGKGTHNTYIEVFFSLGILGGVIFLITLKACMGKVLSKPIMLLPLGMLLFRMMAIGVLTYDNLWLYLSLLVVLSKNIEEKAIEA